MIPNTVSLSSIPATANSFGSLASLGSLAPLSIGLACAATTVSGFIIPVEHIRDVGAITDNADKWRNSDGGAGIHARGSAAGERTDANPAPGGPKKGDGRADGSLPQGPEAKAGGNGLGMKSPGQVLTACTVPGTAALTFDDGPYLYTEEVSRILKDNGAVGTFFFNGQNFGCINEPNNAARVKAAYDAGHQVASHTWSHKDLATLGQEEIVSEMSSVTQAIQKIVGVTPAFMRPPYGSYNDGVLEAAAQINQDVVLWNVDSGDSAGAPPSESLSRYDQAVQQNLPILALNHETHETTVRDVLPGAIQKLKAAGYRLVTVAECVGKEPYLKDPPPLPPSDLNCN